MNRNFRQFITILLCCCMLFTALPTSVLATGGDVTYHTVDFKVKGTSSDGFLIASQQVKEGEAVDAVPAAPDFDGYRFEKWSDNLSQPVSEDVTVYAEYAALSGFTVTVTFFDAQDNKLQPDYVASFDTEYAKAQIKSLGYIDIPVPSSLQGLVTTQKVQVTTLADQTIKVIYTEPGAATYTVTHLYQRVDKTWPDPDAAQISEEDKSLIVTKTSTGTAGLAASVMRRDMDGFETGTFTPVVILADGTTRVLVRYARKVYTLSFDTGADADQLPPAEMLHGAALTELPTPTRRGYTFDAWYLDAGLSKPVTADATVTADTILYAKWNGAEVGYSVVFWREASAPDENGDPLFDYAGIDTSRKAAVGSTVSPSSADTALGGNGAYAYFHYPDGTNDKEPVGPSVEVRADGSTILNVYYYRNTYTLTFTAEIDGATRTATHTAKYGADITGIWPITFTYSYNESSETWEWRNCENKNPKLLYYQKQEDGWFYYKSYYYGNYGNEYRCKKQNGKGQWQEYIKISSTTPREKTFTCTNYVWDDISDPKYFPKKVATLELMPGANVTFSGWNVGKGGTVIYYIEQPSGQYAEYKRITLGEGYSLTKREEFHDIEGFTQKELVKGELTIPYDHISDTALIDFPKSGIISLYYARNSYHLDFHNGVEKVDSATQSVKYQAPLSGVTLPGFGEGKLPVPEAYAGYTFDGWYTAPNGAGEKVNAATTLTMPVGGLVLYVYWKLPSYTVSFTVKGSAYEVEGQAPQTVTKNAHATRPQDPQTEANETFLGWYLGDNAKPFDFGSTPITGNITLAAKFKVDTTRKVIIRYVDEAQKDVAEPQEQTAAVGDILTLSAPAISGMFPDAARKVFPVPESGDYEVVFTYTAAKDTGYTVLYMCGEEELGRTTGTTMQQTIRLDYKAFEGYTPNAYQMTVQISSDAAENVFTFQYTKNASASYTIRYLFQDLAGSGYTEDTTLRTTGSAPVGTTVQVPAARQTAAHFTRVSSMLSLTVRADADKNELNVYFDREMCAITFTAGAGGTLLGTSAYSVRYGTPWSDITVPDAMPDLGYTFTGWTPTLPDGGAAITATQAYAASFAKDPALWHNVTYIANAPAGKTVTGTLPAAQSYAQGMPVSIAEPGDLKVTNYTFSGWKTDAAGTTAAEAFTMGTQDVTIYGSWTALGQYSVTYHANAPEGAMADGSTIDASSPYYLDDTATALANGFIVTGYDFVAWNTEPDGKGESFAPEDEIDSDDATGNAIMLYAQWKKDESEWFDVTYQPNGGVGEAYVTSHIQGTNVTLDETTTFTRENHSFIGWSLTETGATTATINGIQANQTVYAQWAEHPSVTYHANNGADPAQSKRVYFTGTEQVVAKTAAGYGFTTPKANEKDMLFVGWTNEALAALKKGEAEPALLKKAGEVVNASSESVVFYALWAEDLNGDGGPDYLQYTVSYDANGGTGDVPQTAYYNKNAVTLPKAAGQGELARLGHEFTGWNTARDGKGTGLTPGDEIKDETDVTLYAQWRVNSYDVTYMVQFVDETGKPEGTAVAYNSGGNDATLAYDVPVVLPVLPTEEGFANLPAGWKQADGAAAPDTMPAEDITLTATLQRQTYTLTYALLHKEKTITLIPGATTPFGAAITSQGAPASGIPEGYVFDSWIDEPLTMPAKDITVYAKINKGTFNVLFKVDADTAEADTVKRPLEFEAAIEKTQAAPADTLLPDGKYFVAWAWDTVPDTMPAKDITVYAVLADKGEVTLTAKAAKRIYTGETQTVEGEIESSDTAVITDGVAKPTATGKDAKDYTLAFAANAPATLKDANGKVYDVTYQNGTLTIDPAKLTVTAKGQSRKYGEANPDLTHAYTITGFVKDEEHTVTITGAPVVSTQAVAASPVKAGGYPITVDVSGMGAPNYTFEAVSGVLHVAKREVSLKSVTLEKKFDNTPLTNNGAPVTVGSDGFADGEGATYSFTGAQTEVGESDNSFTYTLTDGTSAENYTITRAFGKLKVTTTDAPLTLSATGVNAVYNGKAMYISDVTAANGSTITYSIGGGAPQPWSGNGPAFIHVADSVSVTLYAKNAAYENDAKITVNVTIAPRPIALQSAGASKAYDGTALVRNDPNKDVTLTSANGWVDEGVSYTFPASSAVKYVADGEVDNAFEVAYDAAKIDSRDYDVSRTYGKLKITPKTASIVLKADDGELIYDGTPLTAAGYAYVQGESELAAGDTLTVVTEGSAVHVKESGPVNRIKSATVVQGGLDVTGNYTFGAHQPGTLTVKPRPIEVTADSDSKKYDGAVLTAKGYALTGGSLVGDDAIAEVSITGAQRRVGSSGNLLKGVRFDENTTEPDDYDVKLIDGTLIVTRDDANVIVVTANSNAKTYDGTPLTASGYTLKGAVFSAAGDTLKVTMTADSTKTNVAGKVNNRVEKVQIWNGSEDVTDCYNIGASVPGTLTINPAPLTVRAENKTRAYNAANPALTYTVTGFVHGETAAKALTGTPALSTTAGTATSGDYPITVSQGTLKALHDNYTFNFASATLTVTPYVPPTTDPATPPDPGDPSDPTTPDTPTDPTTPDTPADPTTPDTPATPPDAPAPATNPAPAPVPDPVDVVDIMPEPVPLAPPEPAPEADATDVVDIPVEPVPLAKKHTWALFNLIFAGLSVFLAVIALFVRHREDEERDRRARYEASFDEEEKKRVQRHLITKVFGVVMALAGVIVFLLTEMPLDNMVYTDRYTLLMAVMFAVHGLSAILGLRRHDKDDDEDKRMTAKA